LEGSDVAEALPIFDTTSGVWAVSLDLTSEGGTKFAQLTAEAASYPPGDPRRQIAIVLDGAVMSAPSVNPDVSPTTGITGGSALITVGADSEAQQEAQDLALTLRYGSLPVAFEVSAVQKVSATLGTDSLQSGIIAGLLGLGLVAIVLTVFYRSLGLVAIVGLTVFGSLLIALFGLLGEFQGLTLTLAGVTGIIVSVGITADSYIVYYERIKEKVREGLSIEEAADEGFTLAFRTILTADTVSLLAAILLWFLAVGAVKGFAIALGLATILDIFVARTFTRRAVLLMALGRLGAGGWFSIRGAAR
jgi:protein-export membrane protein SecD